MSAEPRGAPSCMPIVAGHLLTDPADRDALVPEGTRAVALARSAPGCPDFALTANTLEPARVNVVERWASEEELLAFRGSGADGNTAARILGADVRRYAISSVGYA